MTARVLVIGLDAAEATLIDRLAGAGELPAFASLGASSPLANSMRTLPGAIWPELTTGRSSGRLPLYHHPWQLHTGEDVARRVAPEEIDPELFFWVTAVRAGRKVACIDLPQTVLAPRFNGVQIIEWATHDRLFAPASDPPSLLDELVRRYRQHPVQSCDDVYFPGAGKEPDYERLLADLVRSVADKAALVVELLGSEAWDLVACAFSEAHCVGHMFWHLFDPTFPLHPEHVPERLRRAIPAVYRALDDAVAAIRRAAGTDTWTLVVASHGMGPYVGGYQLLPAVLERLGCGRSGTLVSRARARVGPRARTALRRLVPTSARRHLNAAAASTRSRLGSGVLATAFENNRCGAVRLNLVGREPHGRVHPGDEARALLEAIRAELLALRDPVSKEPIVAATVTADEAFGAGHHPDVPDLMVDFRTDLGPLEACVGPRAGRIEVPLWDRRALGPLGPRGRTGDHTTVSRLWLEPPHGVARPELHHASVLDVAPTVLALLGVSTPAGLDGRSLA